MLHFCLIFARRGRVRLAPFVCLHRLVGPSSSESYYRSRLSSIFGGLSFIFGCAAFPELILDGGWVFLLIAGSRDVSSQDSIVPIFSRVGGHIASTYYTLHSRHACAVIHVFARVCRTLGIVREFLDAASGT